MGLESTDFDENNGQNVCILIYCRLFKIILKCNVFTEEILFDWYSQYSKKDFVNIKVKKFDIGDHSRIEEFIENVSEVLPSPSLSCNL